ncbi:hypothetical protein FHT60_003482 [Novosphingobium sp. BK486]|nr:hypothetical protein [Novosphingobium sp. BK280]MBB3380401.1 hypothetical protein [Novosphingobium sp. BK258]MBB3422053.1 hypothetical protein [Novosphingobium sp. BK267]MBB3450770.1 hypothetical protein [Novosphingobium sp. BK352]MBB3479261.1 hypothetical protein [Novosphingobium sp. BK369]MBB3502575.1 hypothetical protein [Novosphingobium sp. BK336]MBB3538379.1 hypothetical protein [Novosphingobium sp. BK486]MBB3557755.1 hypothetical protein [Novosphingobium sp. BK349]MBB3599377.1 hypo
MRSHAGKLINVFRDPRNHPIGRDGDEKSKGLNDAQDMDRLAIAIAEIYSKGFRLLGRNLAARFSMVGHP